MLPIIGIHVKRANTASNRSKWPLNGDIWPFVQDTRVLSAKKDARLGQHWGARPRTCRRTCRRFGYSAKSRSMLSPMRAADAFTCIAGEMGVAGGRLNRDMAQHLPGPLTCLHDILASSAMQHPVQEQSSRQAPGSPGFSRRRPDGSPRVRNRMAIG